MAPASPGAASQLALLPLRREDEDRERDDVLFPVRQPDPVAAAYAEMLSRRAWQWFVTLTFRPDKERPSGGIHPEKADKAFRLLISCINRECFGKNWHRHPERAVMWARGQEFHKSGRIHFHAVAACAHADLNDLTRRMAWVDWWWREFGIARIERPTDQDHVTAYVSKYVTKGGEVDFSPNFDPDALPGVALRDAPPPRANSFTRAPVRDGEPPERVTSTEPVMAFRCLTLSERLQRPLLQPIHLLRQPIEEEEPSCD